MSSTSTQIDTLYIVGFMLNYDIIGQGKISNFDKLLDLIRDCDPDLIKPDLLVAKFFEYTQWKGINPNDAYEIFVNNFEATYKMSQTVVSLEPVEQFTGFLQLHGDKPIVFKPFDLNEVRTKVNYLLNNNLLGKKKSTTSKEEKNVPHDGLPIPDPELGRPHLQWRKCYFQNCGKEFNSPAELVNHLTKCNAYTQGYHWAHEEALYCIVGPDYVRQNNLTKCPSYACNKKSFDTPEGLIAHYQELGIEPFWQKGMCQLVDNNDVSLNNPAEYKRIMCSVPKLFVTEFCMICLDNPVEFILDKCRHHVYCFDCLKTCNKDTCPVCRTKIDKFIPYA